MRDYLPMLQKLTPYTKDRCMLHEYMCYHINLCRFYLGGLTRHFGKPTWTKILGCWVQPIVDPLQHHFHSSATSIQNYFTITKLLYEKCIYISSQCTTSLIILGPNLLIFILHNLDPLPLMLDMPRQFSISAQSHNFFLT